jgi:hypothetical protein
MLFRVFSKVITSVSEESDASIFKVQDQKLHAVCSSGTSVTTYYTTQYHTSKGHSDAVLFHKSVFVMTLPFTHLNYQFRHIGYVLKKE